MSIIAPRTAIIILGLATSGKTTLGQALAKATHLPLVDIDEGPALCTLPHPQPVEADAAIALLQKVMRVRYRVLFTAIEANLAEGFSLIAVATFSKQSYRDELEQAISRAEGNLKVILCHYNTKPFEVKRRITGRVQSNAVGGVRSIQHFRQHRNTYEELRLPHLAVQMELGTDIAEAVRSVLTYVSAG